MNPAVLPKSSHRNPTYFQSDESITLSFVYFFMTKARLGLLRCYFATERAIRMHLILINGSVDEVHTRFRTVFRFRYRSNEPFLIAIFGLVMLSLASGIH